MLFPSLRSGNATGVLLRAWTAFKSTSWATVASGFMEPVLYLLAMGMGMGALVGDVVGPDGNPMSYAAYIAPALLTTSAMNGAVYESTWNVFFKLRFGKIYQVMLQTPMGPMDIALGEVGWALLRGLAYGVAFMVVAFVMGLVTSLWALLMVPVALLVALGFAGFGMGITSYLTNFRQMDVVGFVMLPMFLFSATLYPITVYPEWIQWVVKVMPLWHGVELMRGLSIGYVTWGSLGHLAYFLVMAGVGLTLMTLRLRKLFLR